MLMVTLIRILIVKPRALKFEHWSFYQDTTEKEKLKFSLKVISVMINDGVIAIKGATSGRDLFCSFLKIFKKCPDCIHPLVRFLILNAFS